MYGPPGLNSILNLMLPFINRKHPILKVIEIEVHKKERIKGGLLELVPICAAEVRNNKLFNLMQYFMFLCSPIEFLLWQFLSIRSMIFLSLSTKNI